MERVRVELERARAELERTRAELAALAAGLERDRAESRELGIELALRRGALELVGKGRGADPENLTRREKAILVRGTSEAFGLPVAVLLARVGLARSTYFHQLRAMARPDRDEGLLALVREAFENSGRRYGYRRVWLELRGAGIVVSAKRVMRLMTRHGLVPPLKRARRYSSYRGEIGGELQLVQGRDRRRGAREPREPGLPRRGAEPPVGHGHHRVPHPRGQGVPVAGDRLP